MEQLELIQDLGRKYGQKRPYWAGLFRCYCGKEFEASLRHVKTGHTTSCGCRRKTSIRTKIVTHDKSKLPIYKVWLVIRQRCVNPKCKEYKWYGARGIKMCERWNDFQLFYDDIGVNYKHGLQIDRINGDGNYEPGNCRLVTSKENNRNRRNNRCVPYRGRMVCISELAEILNVTVSKITYALKKLGIDDGIAKIEKDMQKVR